MNLKRMIAPAALIIGCYLFSYDLCTAGDTAAMRQRQEAMMKKSKEDLSSPRVQVD